MNGKIKRLLVLFAVITMVGTASAQPAIDIQTNTESAAAEQTLTVYVGVDSCDSSVGLKAYYTGWDTDVAVYKVKVWDTNPNPDVLVYQNPTTDGVWGSIDSDPKNVGICWTPENEGDGRYKIIAEGSQEGTTLEAYVRVSTRPDSVPELPTSALMSIGLVGLIGMVWLRRKN